MIEVEQKWWFFIDFYFKDPSHFIRLAIKINVLQAKSYVNVVYPKYAVSKGLLMTRGLGVLAAGSQAN